LPGEKQTFGLAFVVVGLTLDIVFHADLSGLDIGSFNLNGFPSTQGYRYLLPSVIVLLLVSDIPDRYRKFGVSTVLVLASLWSFETFVFAAGPFLAASLLDAVRLRFSRSFLRDLAVVLSCAVVGHAALVAYLIVAYGTLPDYRPYFEIISNFTPGLDLYWGIPINPYFGLWLPFAVSFFCVLAVTARDAILGERTHTMAWRLLPVAVLGVAEATYFVGRSTDTTLGVALMPFLILVAVALEGLIARWRLVGWRLSISERSLVALIVATSAAFCFERFSRPYDIQAGNATILRQCFTAEGCSPSLFARHIRENFLERRPTLFPQEQHIQGASIPGRLLELATLVERHFGDEDKIPLIVERARLNFIGMLTLSRAGKWYLWSLNSPVNDAMSPTLVAKLLASKDRLKAGMKLVVDSEPDALLDSLRELLAQIRAQCILNLQEKGAYYDVFVVSRCPD
jgi:hypothetical protein